VTGYAWVFNFDAELELSRKNHTTSAALLADLERHSAGAHALLGPDDVRVEQARPGMIGRAWCPTPRALAKLKAAGVTPEPHPDAAVLRRVNHRLFAHELGGGLSGQHYVTADFALPPGRWMLKRPLTFAGRGQLRVDGPLDDKQRAWIAASLRTDGLIVEPLVTPSLEVSLHGFVWRDGHFELGRLCEQAVSERGVYRAAKLAKDVPEAPLMVATAERVAHALHVAGYFGPFGIDGYRHEGGFCALSEINARYTMAFAVGFPRPAHTMHL
jgi:hypothetical protein